MGICRRNLFGENPVKADLPGVVRQVQQPLPRFQLPAEFSVHLLVQLHIQDVVQHLGQFRKADLPLEGRKVQIVPQDGELQSRKHRILSGSDLLPEHREPLQHEPVGVDLLLAEPVDVQAVVLVKKLRRLGTEPGSADTLRRCQVHLHHILGKGHGLLLRAQGTDQLYIPPQVTQQAVRVDGNAHTFSFRTSFFRAWGASR